MGSALPLLAFLLMTFSGSVHRRQLIVVELLQAENLNLKARLRGKRVRFTDAERALLARKARWRISVTRWVAERLPTC